ncbi:hypothetical protein [Raoultibacter phocaeensis]|uniref:hypothetical protein n=1 Tax=Raoultibacter phocaeensis TaxID=2479841 RepID=UPI00111ADF0B|nr:hypothetical protein [Raoultibacter phocaeensis]
MDSQIKQPINPNPERVSFVIVEGTVQVFWYEERGWRNSKERTIDLHGSWKAILNTTTLTAAIDFARAYGPLRLWGSQQAALLLPSEKESVPRSRDEKLSARQRTSQGYVGELIIRQELDCILSSQPAKPEDLARAFYGPADCGQPEIEEAARVLKLNPMPDPNDGITVHGYCSLSMYRDARYMMELATYLKAVKDDEREPKDTLKEAGFVFLSRLGTSAQIDRDLLADIALSGKAIKVSDVSFAFDPLTGYQNQGTECLKILELKSKEYQQLLADYQKEVGGDLLYHSGRSHCIIYDQDAGKYMIGHDLDKTLSKDSCVCASTQMLDTLLNMHLRDIVTFAESGKLSIESKSLLGALWFIHAAAIGGHRVGLCEVCGTPYYTKSDKRRPRQYCSPACNKKSQRMRASKSKQEFGDREQ